MTDWNAFPYDNQAYQYQGADLTDAWEVLHKGDREPLPENEHLLQAWRFFHAGDFQQAVNSADELGIDAHAVANKATGIYANYLEDDADRQVALFQQAIERAERAIEALPDDPNAHYFHAFNLGRYSQSTSVVKAIKQGLAGKIRDSLERALELKPKHAEAHTALGLYHAEIIDKIGKLMGSVTYGASPEAAIEHLQTAVELTPDSPIAHIEYGNGLYLLYGDRKIDEVTDCYVRASEMTPRDAMEHLDVAFAQSELE
jgi:tetratricopeptide (TPR) repeat protein